MCGERQFALISLTIVSSNIANFLITQSITEIIIFGHSNN